MTDQIEFKEAGDFLRLKRKERGYKTQKSFIAALHQVDPDISCSESYISLIEKGVKTPGVHLLDIMAQVLELSPAEKGELLLTYKRVPSDFEFAVRDNLREAAQQTRLDRLRQQYQEAPGHEIFKQFLKALVLEGQTDEAMSLLKQAPTFENELFELQLRTACMATLSGNYEFAQQAFELSLGNTRNQKDRAEVLIDLGVLFFQRGLQAQNSDLYAAMNFYLKAMECYRESLSLSPEDDFVFDEQTRCAYHLGDGLLQLQRKGMPAKAELKKYPELAKALEQWCGKKVTPLQLAEQSQVFFRQALDGYEAILAKADRSPLPDKPLREAVYFYSYTHAKLKLFEQARVLIHSNLILDRNWLIWFMKACISLMEYENDKQSQHLDMALEALGKAMDYDADMIRYQVRVEWDRELYSLTRTRADDLEALLKQHAES